MIPSGNQVHEKFYIASDVVAEERTYHVCMPDYHVDDIFHAENRTFKNHERSTVTMALLTQLKLNKNDTCAVPMQERVSVPEIVTEHNCDT